MGSFDEVKANVREFGNLRSIRFHKGFFSDECSPEDFVCGRIIEEPHPDRVIEPICDAFRDDGRTIKGNFVAGHTAFFRDEKQGLPALMAGPLLRLKDALLV